MNNLANLLSVADVSRELGVAVSTIAGWIQRGEVAYVVVGKRRFITPETLEELKVRPRLGRGQYTRS